MYVPHQMNQPRQVVSLPGAVRWAVAKDVFDFDNLAQRAAVRRDDLKVGWDGDARRRQRAIEVVPRTMHPHVRVGQMRAGWRFAVGEALSSVEFDVVHPVGGAQESDQRRLLRRGVARPLRVFRVLFENGVHPHAGARRQVSVSDSGDGGVAGLVPRPGRYRSQTQQA